MFSWVPQNVLCSRKVLPQLGGPTSCLSLQRTFLVTVDESRVEQSLYGLRPLPATSKVNKSKQEVPATQPTAITHIPPKTTVCLSVYFCPPGAS